MIMQDHTIRPLDDAEIDAVSGGVLPILGAIALRVALGAAASQIVNQSSSYWDSINDTQ